MNEKKPVKEVKEVLGEKEKAQIVDFLSHAFKQASQGMGKAIRSKEGNKTTLYQLQVDFCYMIDEIQRGPTYIVPMIVTECNEMIAKIAELKAQQNAEAQA